MPATACRGRMAGTVPWPCANSSPAVAPHRPKETPRMHESTAQDAARWLPGAPPIRYPDPAIVVLDPRFERLALPMAAVERIATGCRFTEGPVWFGALRQLVFSDIPNDQLMR